jgi:transposase
VSDLDNLAATVEEGLDAYWESPSEVHSALAALVEHARTLEREAVSLRQDRDAADAECERLGEHTMSTSDDIRIIKDVSALLAAMADGAHVDDVRAELVAALERLAARIEQLETENAALVAWQDGDLLLGVLPADTKEEA